MKFARHHTSSTEILLRQVRQSGKLLRFRKRQIIFSIGDRSDSFFLIESGSVKLTLTSPQGKEAVVGVLHPGDFFGANVLGEHRTPRANNAIAVSDLCAITMGREAMLQLLHQRPEICDAFIFYLIDRILKLHQDIGDQLLYGSEQRLARALLSVAHLNEKQESQVLPKMSQQDLANMIGITRQRVNALLKRFKKSGLIDYAGGLRVHSSIRNAAHQD